MERPGHDDGWEKHQSGKKWDTDYIEGDPELDDQHVITLLVFRALLNQKHPVEQIADIPVDRIRTWEMIQRLKNRMPGDDPGTESK